MKNSLRIGSLFCGAGGFDLGFINASHKIIWAVDNDDDCVQTYRNNIGNHVILNDVANIDFIRLPKVDLIIGGFPCQGFSLANKHRSTDDTRNLLYKQFVRAVSDTKPDHFLAENVKGILSLDKGQAIKAIINDFKKVGYNVEYKTFNASDYGVPQNRIRVLIWGIREELNINRIWPNESTRDNKITIGEALKDIPDPEEKHNLANHIGSKYKITNRNYIGCRTTDPNKPSPTIIARGNGKGGVNAIQHPNNHRRMTVREQAIIQTFPNDFEFSGSMSSCYRQIGNAVPVKFAEAVGMSFSKIK